MKKIIVLLIIILIPNLSLALEFKKIKKEAVVTNSKIIFPITHLPMLRQCLANINTSHFQ